MNDAFDNAQTDKEALARYGRWALCHRCGGGPVPHAEAECIRILAGRGHRMEQTLDHLRERLDSLETQLRSHGHG